MFLGVRGKKEHICECVYSNINKTAIMGDLLYHFLPAGGVVSFVSNNTSPIFV